MKTSFISGIRYVLGLPSFNFVKNMQKYKSISQKGSINFYFKDNGRFECKVYRYSGKSHHINDIKDMIFGKECNETKILLINTSTGNIYGVAKAIKPTNKSIFEYSILYSLRANLNLYKFTDGEFAKDNWFEFFGIEKYGGRQNKPHLFPIGHGSKKRFNSLFTKLESLGLVQLMHIGTNGKKVVNNNQLDNYLKRFASKIKSNFFLYEGELQHDLLRFLIQVYWKRIITGHLDIFNEFPQYKENKKEFITTQKRFDIVILNSLFDEPEAYLELKLCRYFVKPYLIEELLSDYKKITDDAFYNQKKYLRIIIVSLNPKFEKELFKDKKVRKIKKFIKIINIKPKNESEIDTYVKNAGLLKYED